MAAIISARLLGNIYYYDDIIVISAFLRSRFDISAMLISVSRHAAADDTGLHYAIVAVAARCRRYCRMMLV